MAFRKKRDWDDQYDEGYLERSDRPARKNRSTIWIHLAAIAIGAGLLLGAVGLVGGQTMFEKTLTALTAPLGLVWLGLGAVVYFGFLFRQSISAMLALACWLVLTVFGNDFVSNQMIHGLEKSQLAFEPESLGKLDVLFVLGGGTTTTLQGRPQVSSAGSRVVTAAQLYHGGQVDRLVCTGRQWNRTSAIDLHPREEAARLLTGLGVPESAIAMIEGVNTSEEMTLAAAFLEQQQLASARIGIVTSAYHIPRAERLAHRNGLSPIMIPSDFHSGFFTPGPNLLIPSETSLETSRICFKEYLAALIGR